MNASLKNRLAQLEEEQRFQDWVQSQRFLESLSDEQLHDFADSGRLPDPLPAPLPFGQSQLDTLDRKSLVKLWEEHEREWAGRDRDELVFYTAHGHWPEEPCTECNMCVRAREGDGNVCNAKSS
jgi:hypothetical protein